MSMRNEDNTTYHVSGCDDDLRAILQRLDVMRDLLLECESQMGDDFERYASNIELELHEALTPEWKRLWAIVDGATPEELEVEVDLRGIPEQMPVYFSGDLGKLKSMLAGKPKPRVMWLVYEPKKVKN